MLQLKVKDRSVCILQVYVPNTASDYQAFVNDVNDALQRVGPTESTILLGDFNAHIGIDSETWNARLVGMETQRLSRTAAIYCRFVVATGSAL